MDLTALRGRRLLVPVTAQRRHLAQRLAQAGAIVEEAEFIAIAPAEDQDALEEATLAWCSGDYDWLAVTSRNALRAMERIASARGMSLAAPLPDAKVATVGEATRAVCESLGLDVTLVPSGRQNARGIVEEFPDGPGRVLAPLGNLAAPVLPRGLERKGWQVHGVEAYRTIDGPGVGRATREELEAGEFDAVLLTSGSVAERFAASVPHLPEHTMVVAIGDMTAASARAAGLTVSAVATAPSYDGIVAGLLEALDPDVAEAYDDEDASEAVDGDSDSEVEQDGAERSGHDEDHSDSDVSEEQVTESVATETDATEDTVTEHDEADDEQDVDDAPAEDDGAR
ncbi:uroporphyrinogen-III synthase [Demequina muriae]|uniref:Uroporphyrinogen-III synthase n=1 Tax=Demequina muriae TaxID=3051664 RepID=A0ABT8GIX5_9MICO|nr:uroporphyrinogen-III synthase [Demequina sp. EGI L300058]MDN4481390.1 uroporphyrinogen-III synthase [Demequina sp. EGI L300058]